MVGEMAASSLTPRVRVGMRGGMVASCGSRDGSLCEGENGGRDGYLERMAASCEGGERDGVEQNASYADCT